MCSPIQTLTENDIFWNITVSSSKISAAFSRGISEPFIIQLSMNQLWLTEPRMLSMWQHGSVLVGVSLQFEALPCKLKKTESLNMAGQEGKHHSQKQHCSWLSVQIFPESRFNLTSIILWSKSGRQWIQCWNNGFNGVNFKSGVRDLWKNCKGKKNPQTEVIREKNSDEKREGEVWCICGSEITCTSTAMAAHRSGGILETTSQDGNCLGLCVHFFEQSPPASPQQPLISFHVTICTCISKKEKPPFSL